jgi:hypothetical protein
MSIKSSACSSRHFEFLRFWKGGTSSQRYGQKCELRVITSYNMRIPRRMIGSVKTKWCTREKSHTRKISQVVNKMCSHYLFPVVDKSGTSCHHILHVTRLMSRWGQQTVNKLFQQIWYRLHVTSWELPHRAVPSAIWLGKGGGEGELKNLDPLPFGGPSSGKRKFFRKMLATGGGLSVFVSENKTSQNISFT